MSNSWKRLELIFLVLYALAFYGLVIHRSLQLSHDHSRRLFGLRHGWISNRLNDLSDSQWRNFRENLPVLTLVLGLFTLVGNTLRSQYHLKGRGMSVIWFLISLSYLSYLHGTWDAPLLLSRTCNDLSKDNAIDDKLKIHKITIYVEHPLPIEPPAEPAPPPPQPLKLTKKEQKKLRTQRRLAKEDRQEMTRQGPIESPKPKIKMSNLMKVLGSEATQDPTRLEMEIRRAAAEREQAHVARNIARKLTPSEETL